MKKNEIQQIHCSLARAVAEVGDTWKILIIKELFWHNHKFDGILRQTGMSSYSLSTRLEELKNDGIVEKKMYVSHPPRFEYSLTDKGMSLWAVLTSLTRWGDTWCNQHDSQVIGITHRGCSSKSHAILVCSDCGEPMHAHTSKFQATPEVLADRSRRDENSIAPY